jgi:hypothetical protein
VAVHLAYINLDEGKTKRVAGAAKKSANPRGEENATKRSLEAAEKKHHQKHQPDQAKAAVWIGTPLLAAGPSRQARRKSS